MLDEKLAAQRPMRQLARVGERRLEMVSGTGESVSVRGTEAAWSGVDAL